MPFNPRTLGNIFSDYGQGLLRGRNLSEALAYGAQQGSQMQPYRDAQLQQEQQQSKLEQQTNQTIEWLKSHGYDDLVAAVGGGMPIGTAWQEGLTRFNAKPAAPRTGEINNRLVNMDTGQVIGDYSDPAKPTNLPTSYQEYLLGQQDPRYAAQLASSTSRPQTDAVRRAGALLKTAQDEANLLLGDGTAQNPGIFNDLADGWDQALDVNVFGANPGRPATSANYQRAKASIESFAQTYLYVMSGAAAPASEVAKIVDSLTPKFGESPTSVAEKKRRLQTYLNAMTDAAQRNPQGAAPQDVPTPNGIDPGDWQYMTPEERQLFGG